MEAGQHALPSGQEVVAFLFIGMHGQAGDLKPVNLRVLLFGIVLRVGVQIHKLHVGCVGQIVTLQQLVQQRLVKIIRNGNVQRNFSDLPDSAS